MRVKKVRKRNDAKKLTPLESGDDPVQAELDRLVRLTKFSFEEAVDHWQGSIEFDNAFKNLFAGLIYAGFVKSKGINYVEYTMDSPEGSYLVTIQRKAGKTPHELRMEAETELARLRAQLEEMAREILKQETP